MFFSVAFSIRIPITSGLAANISIRISITSGFVCAHHYHPIKSSRKFFRKSSEKHFLWKNSKRRPKISKDLKILRDLEKSIKYFSIIKFFFKARVLL